MELFAAATGCPDPAVACFYLERAGNDVTRAVNHFFDSPTTAVGEASGDACSQSTTLSRNAGSGSSNRSLKRQRATSAGEGKQQQPFVFERIRPSMGGSSSSGTALGTEHSHARAAAAAAPSAEWTEIAERCVRCA